MGKLYLYSAQLYDTPLGKARKISVVIQSIELDRVRAMKWNAERVIVFNLLSSNTHKNLIIPHKYESAYFLTRLLE